jgi:diguanylate cyclase (GGDEF)-like protein
VAAILDSGARQVDLAARYGGEEFALLTPETDIVGAMKLAERLRSAIEAATVKLPNGAEVSVTASLGVAVKGELERPEQLVTAADEALYEAKRNGKNRIVTADQRPEAAAATTA